LLLDFVFEFSGGALICSFSIDRMLPSFSSLFSLLLFRTLRFVGSLFFKAELLSPFFPPLLLFLCAVRSHVFFLHRPRVLSYTLSLSPNVFSHLSLPALLVAGVVLVYWPSVFTIWFGSRGPIPFLLLFQRSFIFFGSFLA